MVNRPVLIAAAICAALLLGMAALRFAGGPVDEEPSARRDRLSATEAGAEHRADARDHNRATRWRGDGNATTAEQPGHASRDLREGHDERVRNRPAIASRDGAADAMGGEDSRRGGEDGERREGKEATAFGGRRAADLASDDANFRAAAEGLPDTAPAAPEPDAGDEEAEDAADDLAREPPATPVVDDSMTYNSGDYRFSLDSPFQIPNSGDAGTVALWLQPEWSADNQDDASMIELGDGLFRVYKNVNVLRFEVMSDHPEHSAGISIAEWQPGEWHAISATWQSGEVTFYVDGQPVGAPIRGSFEMQGPTPVTIGALHPPDQQVAAGTVSDVSLRNRALSANEITRLYNRSALVKRQ